MIYRCLDCANAPYQGDGPSAPSGSMDSLTALADVAHASNEEEEALAPSTKIETIRTKINSNPNPILGTKPILVMKDLPSELGLSCDERLDEASEDVGLFAIKAPPATHQSRTEHPPARSSRTLMPLAEYPQSSNILRSSNVPLASSVPYPGHSRPREGSNKENSNPLGAASVWMGLNSWKNTVTTGGPPLVPLRKVEQLHPPKSGIEPLPQQALSYNQQAFLAPQAPLRGIPLLFPPTQQQALGPLLFPPPQLQQPAASISTQDSDGEGALMPMSAGGNDLGSLTDSFIIR